jgi:large subunit ribosomal protein L2
MCVNRNDKIILGKRGGSRFTSISKVSFPQSFKKARQLLLFNKNQAGRNSSGQITVRHQGGGAKVGHRVVDHKRNLISQMYVLRLESVPRSTRTAFLALVSYPFSVLSYVLAPHGIKAGDFMNNYGYSTSDVSESGDIELKVGCCVSISALSPSTQVFNVESVYGKGAVFARAAGTSCIIKFISNDFRSSLVMLPSGNHVKLSFLCRVTIGKVSNIHHNNDVIGSAGRNRNQGIRPTVRGSAMNPVDHPHGGGEGRSNSGRPSVTPWGKITKGQPTCKKKHVLARKRLAIFKDYI